MAVNRPQPNPKPVLLYLPGKTLLEKEKKNNTLKHGIYRRGILFTGEVYNSTTESIYSLGLSIKETKLTLRALHMQIVRCVGEQISIRRDLDNSARGGGQGGEGQGGEGQGGGRGKRRRGGVKGCGVKAAKATSQATSSDRARLPTSSQAGRVLGHAHALHTLCKESFLSTQLSFLWTCRYAGRVLKGRGATEETLGGDAAIVTPRYRHTGIVKRSYRHTAIVTCGRRQ